MRYRSLLSSLVLLGAVLGGAGACSDQGEGQRCDLLNNSDDCTTPLICKSIPSPVGAAICCPPPNAPITVDACRASAGTLNGADGGPVHSTDAGTHRDAGTKDASR